MPWIDLNDTVTWRSLGLKIDNGHVQNAASQFAWRAKGVWTSQDFVGRKIHIPAHYYEDGHNVPFAQAKAQLTQSGEQYLSFDGGLTGMRVRCNSFAEFDPLDGFPTQPATSGSTASYAWGGTLEFLSRNPFAEDVGQTFHDLASLSSLNSYTTNVVTYGGHAFCSPSFTINTSGAGVCTGIALKNIESTENLLIQFPPNPPATTGIGSITGSHTIVVNGDLSSAVMDGNTNLTVSGSFPQIYPNVAIANSTTIQTILFQASGTGSMSLTCNMAFTTKYEF